MCACGHGMRARLSVCAQARGRAQSTSARRQRSAAEGHGRCVAPRMRTRSQWPARRISGGKPRTLHQRRHAHAARALTPRVVQGRTGPACTPHCPVGRLGPQRSARMPRTAAAAAAAGVAAPAAAAPAPAARSASAACPSGPGARLERRAAAAGTPWPGAGATRRRGRASCHVRLMRAGPRMQAVCAPTLCVLAACCVRACVCVYVRAHVCAWACETHVASCAVLQLILRRPLTSIHESMQAPYAATEHKARRCPSGAHMPRRATQRRPAPLQQRHACTSHTHAHPPLKPTRPPATAAQQTWHACQRHT